MTRYSLPNLRYEYDALEPALSGQILELHHDKHHRAYVTEANQALDQLEEARARREFPRIPAIERSLAFNVSGHVLHSILWQNLAPESGSKPEGDLADSIKRDFGSLEIVQKQMSELAMTTRGSGWAVLLFDPLTRSLGTTQIHDHQSQMPPGDVPLLVVDAWEHAFYLQYKTDKAAYLKALWSIVNWEDVAARYQKAQNADLALAHAASKRIG